MFSSRLVVLIWFVGLASVAARLPAEELESLSVIARTLGKKGWIFDDDVDPCNQLRPSPWWTSNDSRVECDCSLGSNTTCHVTRIYLRRENLTGSLPRELVGLPFLQLIDLTRNYLNGTIPPEWGYMRSLTNISLLGNRLTGPIPKQLADIATLQELVLEANQFTGTIPSEIGNLTQLRRLVLKSNNLSGPLPPSLAQLTALTEFGISDNNFTGSIPNFIRTLTNITRMEIQGSGLTGPIPSDFSSLPNLIDLRISDLKGSRSDFQKLNVLANWEKLILRSCNIQGVFPQNIGQMKIKDVLDLSFNNLSGQIPPNLADLSANIYLTGNSLSGRVPDRIKMKADINLSYNNFTTESCGENSPNMFANSNGTTSSTFFCAQSTCKPDEYYSFHINCGSSESRDKYEPDSFGGSRNFYKASSNWGFSQTGEFMNPNKTSGYEKDKFTWQSTSSISGPDPELYKEARLSPVSLTYYGVCLRNGGYNVTLHFAEIMFTNDTTSSSLGRRIFDVYIQGKLVLKDFNIKNEAGGVNKAYTKTFVANVSNHTMDIRLYWAGKGTTALPERSVYGPLISAISVVHNSYRPGDSLSTGSIVGIVMAVILAVILVILGILWWQGFLCRKYSIQQDLRGLDLRTGSFTLRQIRAATNNFDPANKIGEGGFGPVYKGVLLDGTIIAVKQLSSKSKQGNREFVNEIGMISALQHPHLVKLYGCCIESNQLLLVYEYMENNSLARALFGPAKYLLHLDWPMRQTICIGIARGLAYLHEESRLKIVHRDIKATNVLLDGNLVPKISDFGLAKLDEEDDTHISTRIAGTFGYMAPEYAMRGYLTDKADVYSFGVVVLEIVSGRSNSSIRPKEESFYLLDWANSLRAKGNLLELVDPRLELNFDKEEVSRAINVALVCTNVVAAERPSMSVVVSMLEGRLGPVKTKGDEVEMVARDVEGRSISMDVPWSGSSTSDADLYPIAQDTSFWVKRGP